MRSPGLRSYTTPKEAEDGGKARFRPSFRKIKKEFFFDRVDMMTEQGRATGWRIYGDDWTFGEDGKGSSQVASAARRVLSHGVT